MFIEHLPFDRHFMWAILEGTLQTFPEGRYSLFPNWNGIAIQSALSTQGGFFVCSNTVVPDVLADNVLPRCVLPHQSERSEEGSPGNDFSIVLADLAKQNKTITITATIGKWYWRGPGLAVHLLSTFLWTHILMFICGLTPSLVERRSFLVYAIPSL